MPMKGTSKVGLIPGQSIRYAESTGIEYNIIVAGEGFTGKSSFIESVLGVSLCGERDEALFHEVCDIACTGNPLADLLEAPIEQITPDRMSVSITVTKVPVIDGAFTVRLTLYEVSGIGDSLNSGLDWIPIRNLILNRYEEHNIEEEKGIDGGDKRIHCCLYFTEPRNTPREIDLVAMKEIGRVTNLIPVISKADMLSDEEFKGIKRSLFTALTSRNVQLFDCILVDECKKVVELSFMPLKYCTPGRKYPWSEIATDDFSDILALRDLLIKSHAVDIVEMTEKFYEDYRRNKMVVEILIAPNNGIDENFRRKISLEESRLKALMRRVEEKRRKYEELVGRHQHRTANKL